MKLSLIPFLLLSLTLASCGNKASFKLPPEDKAPDQTENLKFDTMAENLSEGDSRCPMGGQVLRFMYNGEQVGEDIVICYNVNSNTDLVINKELHENDPCKVEVIVNNVRTCVYSKDEFNNDKGSDGSLPAQDGEDQTEAPAPVGEVPSENSPVTEAPTPSEETPVISEPTPVEETPAVDEPISETPVEDETPVAVTPAPELLDGNCLVKRSARYTVESHFMIQIKNDSPVNLSSFTIKVQFSNGSNITSVANNNGGNSVLHGDSYEINPINRAKNVMIYARSSSGINLDAVTIVSNGETYTCELDR